MRVLHVIDSGGFYGAEQVLLYLIEGLRAMNVECSLASIAEPGSETKPLEKEARSRNIDVSRVTMSRGPDYRAARRLVESARNDGFDVLHTHGYKANIMIAGLPRGTRKMPVIATLHGWTGTRLLSRIGAYEALERLVLRRAESVVAVSNRMVEQWRLDSRYGDRLRVIHNGIPAASPGRGGAPCPARVKDFVDDRKSIFAAGRLSPEKGFDVLIDALALVRSKGVDVCLVLAGEGREKEGLLGRVRDLGIESAVLMPGYVKNVRNLMAYFDVVAIPSRTEGLPIVLLEALMNGIPVAATAVGEMPIVMQNCDAGACVEPHDADSLANRLLSLLQGEDLARNPGAFAVEACRSYSAERMAAAYFELYHEQLAHP